MSPKGAQRPGHQADVFQRNATRTNFIVRQAWRETRGAGRHVAYLLGCITLGVAALVAVGSVGASLERTVSHSARSLLGADVEVRSTQPLSPAARGVIDGLAREGVVATRVLELAAMASTGAGAHLVELKAVEPGYPLYGGPVVDPARPLATLIGQGRALVHDSLLRRLGLQVGDRLRIGESDFVISGRILAEPDRAAGVFAFGPRVLIAAGDLGPTGLLQPGSRVRHRMLLQVPGGRDPEAFRTDLAARLPDPALRVVTYRQAQPGLRRFWDQLTMYLGLTGLVALLVGGIGVGTSVSAFLRGKLTTIAILKCVGLGWRRVLAVYLTQTALLGLGGSLLGAAIGTALQPILTPLLGRLVPFPVELTVSPPAILRGLAMGLGVALLCALPPLLEIRHVPAGLLFRREIEPVPRGHRPWIPVLPIAAGLAALALWQAGSWKVGGLFVLGFTAGLALLLLASRLVIAAARRLARRGGSLVWRQAVANLHRPGSHAGAVLVTLGLAVMLVVAVALLEGNLRAELSARSGDGAPAFFFIDLQPDQAAPFTRLVRERTGETPEVIPVVRSRLAAVKGAPVERDTGARDERWFLTREYVLTWAAVPPGHNTVVAGRWWTAAEAAREPLASVEEEIARSLGVGLGDALTFDVQGVAITARITNFRKVDWRSLGANFFVVLSPGALDGAPATYLATARVAPAGEADLQAAVVRAFPNVAAIPVREVLERIATMVDQIAVAIRVVAAFSILAGLVVLAGALGVTRAQRLYQTVILRALGATRGVVARTFAIEYALLGATAGLAGTLLAAALAWTVQRWLLEVPWSWQPVTLGLGVVLAATLAVAVGFLGTFRLLGQRPLPVLRGE
jgi:putative ABC transport system permease protein